MQEQSLEEKRMMEQGILPSYKIGTGCLMCIHLLKMKCFVVKREEGIE